MGGSTNMSDKLDKRKYSMIRVKNSDRQKLKNFAGKLDIPMLQLLTKILDEYVGK